MQTEIESCIYHTECTLIDLRAALAKVSPVEALVLLPLIEQAAKLEQSLKELDFALTVKE